MLLFGLKFYTRNFSCSRSSAVKLIVMLRRVNFYSICFAFGLSVLLILAGSRYTDNMDYHPSSESRRNLRNFLKIEDVDDQLYQPIPTNPDDGSPNVEMILDKARLRVRLELSDYNYSLSGAHQLEDLLMEAGGQPKRSLIFSTWRSGTTFLGEVLNAMPGNFYHYEPLLKYKIIQIRGPPHDQKALETIKSMFRCNFDNMEDYFTYGTNHLHQFSHNSRLWDHCKYKKELCFDADFTARLCKVYPFQSMKVVRVRLKLVEEILDDKGLNVKVVLLIRDPRAVMQSRQHRDFCPPSPDCWKPELLCADMISDYVAAARLLKHYPDRLLVLRYEELALDPYNKTQQLFNFLGLDTMPSVKEFLHAHTGNEIGGVSSTFRVSRDVPFRWKNFIEYNYMLDIQDKCKEAMNLWGYRLVHNTTELFRKDFDPLLPYTIKL